MRQQSHGQPSSLRSATFRDAEDFSAPLYVTPHKAVWYHRHDGKVTFETRFDEAPAVRLAALERDMRAGQRTNHDMQKIANVPMSVLHRAMVEKWDRSDWWRWANDPANRAFRVWHGRV